MRGRCHFGFLEPRGHRPERLSELEAVGEDVRAPDETGTLPISGLALPLRATDRRRCGAAGASISNLTGAQIVGPCCSRPRATPVRRASNSIYGHGVLDLTRAFQPVGTMSLAGSGGGASQEM